MVTAKNLKEEKAAPSDAIMNADRGIFTKILVPAQHWQINVQDVFPGCLVLAGQQTGQRVPAMVPSALFFLL